MKQPYTNFYIMKGAQFMGDVTAIHVAPEVDVATESEALRTAEMTEKKRESSR